MRFAPRAMVVAAFLGAGLLATPVSAAELLAAERPIPAVVDHYIDAYLQAEKATPAPQAGDAAFVRRVTLDLVGRVPTLAETQAYVGSADPNKREALVDRLLKSPAFQRHLVDSLDALLMQDTGGSLKPYLETAVQANRPWDQMFKDLILARDDDPATKPAAEFLRKRVNDLDRLTNDVSSVFFGVNVSCAKCHDHPLADDWKQDHYYGMKSFFSRTFDNGGFLGEKAYGLVKYQTTKGENRVAKLMFLSGDAVAEPEVPEPTKDEEKKEKEHLEQLKKDKQAPPPPAFSRRAKLVEIALQPEQSRFFTRAITNRVWHRLFGQGLVMPLDQMHSGNPPSHPELLDWLARDLAANRYDLSRLIRGLVLSQTYSRSASWTQGDRPRADLFAVALPKPLTPLQYGSSLRVATLNPDQFAADVAADEQEKRIEAAVASGRGLQKQFETPGEDFQVSVDESLFFSNDPRVVSELLGSGKDRLLDKLAATADSAEAARLAVYNVLGRPATDEEISVLVQYLGARSDRHPAALQQMVWALLTSTEFRFNH